MNRDEVKEICAAAMLRYDEDVLDSLSVIGDMMEEVVHSALCEETGDQVTRKDDGSFCVLRKDEVKAEFSREEMLGGVKCRKGDFALVPAVIK